MKTYLLLLAFALSGAAPEPWPAGERAEAYLAKCTGLQRTEAPAGQLARTRLSNLLSMSAQSVRLTPATALGLHYSSTQDWGEAEVYAYTFARPAALDSAYRLLYSRVEACAGDPDCGGQQQQRPVRTQYVARSHYYLLLFDGRGLTRDFSEFLPLADIYADLLDD